MSAKAKREKPELISDGSKNFRKAGVLEYMDESKALQTRSRPCLTYLQFP